MQLTNEQGDLSWGALVETVQNFEDATSMSLFQYTKRAVVNSRVFIEKPLATEEIMAPLMLNTMNLYTGLILTAMNMNRMVSQTKRVRDAMSVVATESFYEKPQYSEDLMASFFGNIHPNMLTVTNQEGGSPFAATDNQPSTYSSTVNSSIVDTEPKNVNLPSGRVIQIKFGNDKTSESFAVNLYLQLSPYFIPTDVASQFVGLNFAPSFCQRWMQASAGEISFIKDLLLGQDLRKRRRAALKQDKTGSLKEMIERQENSLSNSWLKLAFIQPERQNIANTILIFDKTTFDKACSSAGLRFKDYNSRQKFFNKTFAMILHVVDPMFNKVTSYYHGLNAVSEFTFDQIKRNSKTENIDLMSIMKSYAQGMAPKF